MKKNKIAQEISFRDPNAKAMWGKRKIIVYKDKSKYSRKQKHKNIEF